MGNIAARNPATVVRGSAHGSNPNPPPAMSSPPPNGSESLLDGEKSGATLLFSGIFLGLVGMTFTAMGWLNFNSNRSFEWTQFLGPILLSVGGTFLLISVCKFGMLSCHSCRQQDEDDDAASEMDPIPARQPFVFDGIRQPIMFHSATLVQYIPPPYSSVTREINPATEVQQSASVNGIPRNVPLQIYNRCSLDNPAFVIEEDSSPYNIDIDRSCSRNLETEGCREERKQGSDESSTCPPPPAYEDIYPSAQTDHLS